MPGFSDRIDPAAIAGKICGFVEAGNIHARFYRHTHFQDAKHNAIYAQRARSKLPQIANTLRQLPITFRHPPFSDQTQHSAPPPLHSEALRHPRPFHRMLRLEMPRADLVWLAESLCGARCAPSKVALSFSRGLGFSCSGPSAGCGYTGPCCAFDALLCYQIVQRVSEQRKSDARGAFRASSGNAQLDRPPISWFGLDCQLLCPGNGDFSVDPTPRCSALNTRATA